jgi:hypothetical protein
MEILADCGDGSDYVASPSNIPLSPIPYVLSPIIKSDAVEIALLIWI